MFMKADQIAGLDLDSSPDTDGVSTAFVPVVGVEYGNDFDYDSREGAVYWIEYDSANRKVRVHLWGLLAHGLMTVLFEF